jgi:hypothetical protein
VHKFPLQYSEDFDESLACPVCGFGYTHIDSVSVAARREDAAPTHISVDALSGYVRKDDGMDVPVGPMVGEGRRHRVVLLGSCENGCRFAVVFTQHKGATFVETLAQSWLPVSK